MALPNDDAFITSLIFDYLSQINISFAQDFQKMTNAISLPKGSPTIADVVSHYGKTTRKKLYIKPTDRKKSSSNSSSESEPETSAVEIKKTISKPLRSNVNISKIKRRDTSTEDESSDDETTVAAKSRVASTNEVIPTKPSTPTPKQAARSDDIESAGQETVAKTVYAPKNHVTKKLTPCSSKNATENSSDDSSDDGEPAAKKAAPKPKTSIILNKAKPITPVPARITRYATRAAVKRKSGTSNVASADSKQTDDDSSNEEKIPEAVSVSNEIPAVPANLNANDVTKKGDSSSDTDESDAKHSEKTVMSTPTKRPARRTLAVTPKSVTKKSEFISSPKKLVKKSIPSPAKSRRICTRSTVKKLESSDESNGSEDATSKKIASVNKSLLAPAEVTQVAKNAAKKTEISDYDSDTPSVVRSMTCKPIETRSLSSVNISLIPVPAQKSGKAEESDESSKAETSESVTEKPLSSENVLLAEKSASTPSQKNIEVDGGSDIHFKEETENPANDLLLPIIRVTAYRKTQSALNQKSNEAEKTNESSADEKSLSSAEELPAKHSVPAPTEESEKTVESDGSLDKKTSMPVTNESLLCAKVMPNKKPIPALIPISIERDDSSDSSSKSSSEEENKRLPNKKSTSRKTSSRNSIPALTHKIKKAEESDEHSEEETNKPADQKSLSSAEAQLAKQYLPTPSQESDKAVESDGSSERETSEPVANESLPCVKVKPAEKSVPAPTQKNQESDNSSNFSSDDEIKKSPNETLLSTTGNTHARKSLPVLTPKTDTADKVEQSSEEKTSKSTPDVEKVEESDESSDDDTYNPIKEKIRHILETLSPNKSVPASTQEDDNADDGSGFSSDEDTNKPVKPISLSRANVKPATPASTLLKKSKTSEPTLHEQNDEDCSDEKTEPSPVKKPALENSKNDTRNTANSDSSDDTSGEDESDSKVTKLLKKTNEETEPPPAKKPVSENSKKLTENIANGDSSDDTSDEDDCDSNVTKLPKETDKDTEPPPAKKVTPNADNGDSSDDTSDETDSDSNAVKLPKNMISKPADEISREKMMPVQKSISATTQQSDESDDSSNFSSEEETTKSTTKKLLSTSNVTPSVPASIHRSRKAEESDESSEDDASGLADQKSPPSAKLIATSQSRLVPTLKLKKFDESDESDESSENETTGFLDKKSFTVSTRKSEKAEGSADYSDEKPTNPVKEKSLTNSEVTPAKKLVPTPPLENDSSEESEEDGSSRSALLKSTPVIPTTKTAPSNETKVSVHKTKKAKTVEISEEEKSSATPVGELRSIYTTLAASSLKKSKMSGSTSRKNNAKDCSESTHSFAKKQVPKKPEAKSDYEEDKKEEIPISNPRKRKSKNESNSPSQVQNRYRKFAKAGNSNASKNDKESGDQHRKFAFKRKFSGNNAGHGNDRRSFVGCDENQRHCGFQRSFYKNERNEEKPWNRNAFLSDISFNNRGGGKSRDWGGGNSGRHHRDESSGGPKNQSSGGGFNKSGRFNKFGFYVGGVPQNKKIKFDD